KRLLSLGMLVFASYTVSVAQLRIVSIGNSISQGKNELKFDGKYEWSYRPWLFDKLTSDGFNVDMVGYNSYFFGESEGNMMTVKFPTVAGKPFDPNSEAYYGINSNGFLNGDNSSGWTGSPLPKFSDRINDPTKGYTPDFALIHMGTNDKDSLPADVAITKTNIRGIVSVLRAKNPKVVILLAKLITGWKMINPEIDGLASELNTAQSPVLVVDMATGFKNDPGASGTMTYDWVHPNELGQKFMMRKWYDVIKANLNDNLKPTIPTQLAASEITNTSVKLTWSPSIDNYGLKSYDVYANNLFVASSKLPSLTATQLASGTNYTFKVVAKDLGGNASDSVTVTAKTSGVTGLTDADMLNDINVYPSVTIGLVTIVGAEGNDINVSDLSGRKVLSLGKASNDTMVADLGLLPDGMYLLQIRNSGQQITRRIVLAR
ncbi:MAG TPA: GDSL-type esterase/lipase family protein, partial [Cytophagaceae bacterium]